MTREPAELSRLARDWIAGDPDPATQAELATLLEQGAWVELEQRLEPLAFGTAGLRGAVGAGSGRMNLAVVIRAAYGIARYIAARGSSAPVVIGFDARPTSQSFAEASAGVLLAAGLQVLAFPVPTATPWVAFLGREQGAPLSIVVTASHNPRGDNGYKVYGADAVQIVPPVDRELAEQIALAPAANQVPRRQVSFASSARPTGLTLVVPALAERYFQQISLALAAGEAARDLRIVHSALHGVGTEPMLRALHEAGFSAVSSVAEQAAPDGSFPTTPFPNPEEPGTLDLALAEAERSRAALLLVSDPDADRLAAAARLDGVMTVLDGNQVGALLADALLARAAKGPQPLVLSSVVSSPLIEVLSRSRGAHHERTHTGFKWLWSAALELERSGQRRFAFACEEALGYSVFSGVRDKDGIAAGRALAELAASLHARGATLFDRLHELYAEHGLWASAARNIALTGVGARARVEAALDRLAGDSQLRIGSQRVTRLVDYRFGAAERPSWLGAAQLLELELEGGARAFVRPSGTEPKLKLYAHTRLDVTQRSELRSQLALGRQSAGALLLDLERALEP
jgi:phosphomannomutase